MTERIADALEQSRTLEEMLGRWKEITGDYPDEKQYRWLVDYFEKRLT